jgi:hypothetical protein
VSGNRGRKITIIRTGGNLNAATIARAGSDNILYNNNLYTSVTANTPGEIWQLESDGSQYWVVTGRYAKTLPTSFIPTLNSNTNVNYNQAWYVRDGAVAHIWGRVAWSGAGPNEQFSVSLPFLIDSSSTLISSTMSLGPAMWYDNGTAFFSGFAIYADADTFAVTIHNIGTLNSASFAASDAVTYHLTVPVSGWFN